jgi:hypothetical protein
LTFVIAWTSTLVILLLPIWQSRRTLLLFWRYTTGKRGQSLAT